MNLSPRPFDVSSFPIDDNPFYVDFPDQLSEPSSPSPVDFGSAESDDNVSNPEDFFAVRPPTIKLRTSPTPQPTTATSRSISPISLRQSSPRRTRQLEFLWLRFDRPPAWWFFPSAEAARAQADVAAQNNGCFI